MHTLWIQTPVLQKINTCMVHIIILLDSADSGHLLNQSEIDTIKIKPIITI